MGFTIQLTGAKDYVPYEGGGDRYPFQGKTIGKIVAIEEGKSGTNNDTLIFTMACDEPEAKGLKTKKWVPVSGERKDKKPNVIALYDAIGAVYSVLMPQDQALAKVRALEGQAIDSTLLINELVGKTVAYEVADRAYTKDDGSTGYGTEVKNFISKQAYDEAKATNTHHRALDATPPAPTQNGGQAQTNTPAGGLGLSGAQQQNHAAPPAASPGKSALGIL